MLTHLSNFYSGQIIYNDKEYKTAEHLYQSLRYLDSTKQVDLEYAELIRAASTPHGAKLLGNQTISNTRIEWRCAINQKITVAQSKGLRKVELDNSAVGCMRTALIHKFSQNEECKRVLLETKGRLVYNRDVFWGIVNELKCGEGINAWRDLTGKNHYGKLLEQIRDGSISLPV